MSSSTHRPSSARQPRPYYERAAPNELWHIDMKGPFYFAGTARRGSCHFAGLVDDHSRYLLGIRAVPMGEVVTRRASRELPAGSGAGRTRRRHANRRTSG